MLNSIDNVRMPQWCPWNTFLLKKLTLWGSNFEQGRILGNAFLKNLFGLKGKRLPKQNLLMKSWNDSISGMSFIFMCFGKKSGSQLGIQSLYPLKGKMIRFYQTKRLNEPETLPRSEMLHFKPKDLAWACLFWLVTTNLSCLSVQSCYKTEHPSLQYSILWSKRSRKCTFWGIL